VYVGAEQLEVRPHESSELELVLVREIFCARFFDPVEGTEPRIPLLQLYEVTGVSRTPVRNLMVPIPDGMRYSSASLDGAYSQARRVAWRSSRSC
jgi:hypothetical protein